MAARIAWVLNLDAELELAVPAHTPSAGVREALRTYVPILAASLLEEGDVLVDGSSAPGLARGLAGRAFCASLGPTLPGAAFVTTWDEARAVLERAPEIGDGWRVKRAFGTSGRGQRVLRAGAIDVAEEGFVRAGLARGGVRIEPNVRIETEYAIHGRISEDGDLRLGRLVVQRCDARGAWMSTEPADAPEIEARLCDEATAVARALHEAGYFGPFGIDAFTHRDREGTLVLQPRSEINARYTMGFAVGFNGRARAP
jgi:hypothetical protein